MKKKVLALTLAAVMLLALAACGGGPTGSSTPPSTEPTPSTEPSEPVSTEGTVYTTVINEADVTFTLAADQKSIVVDAMGMTVEGTCEVKDNVLTFKEQTSGNAQIWTSLGNNQYTLNADGTATVGGGGSGSESVYTTSINDADVTITVSADQKSVVVDAMGMTVEGSCEVTDNVLTFKEQTSGNAQIWASLATRVYTLNADGTATEGADGGANDGPAGGNETAAGEVLFSWEGFATMDFNKDGTFNFNYNDLVKESGTWKWENWTLTVTDANGNEMTGAVDSEDNNTLKFQYVSPTNSQLAVDYTCASSVWGPALGASGSYEPVGGSSSAPAAGGVERFAGEYDLYCEAADMYCEEFVIDADGTVHGVVESSGLTSFEGTVSEDGAIAGEVTRLGGTISGTITDDLQVTLHFEVRGSEKDFVGGPL